MSANGQMCKNLKINDLKIRFKILQNANKTYGFIGRKHSF